MKFVLKIGLLLMFLSTTGCWRQVHSDKNMIPGTSANLAEDPDQRYQEIRSRWTIRLSPESSHRGAALGSPLSPRSGGEAGGGMFPLTIRATLMVDTVINAGLQYYEKMAEMSSPQADSFSQSYREGNQLDRYLLIEISLQTSSAENYLDLKRYTIYIEDDQQNKLEPVKMVERPMITFYRPGNFYGGRREFESNSPTFWTRHQKIVFLYFPRRNFLKKPTIRSDMKELKIVFILEEKGSGRVEGKWIFPG